MSNDLDVGTCDQSYLGDIGAWNHLQLEGDLVSS